MPTSLLNLFEELCLSRLGHPVVGSLLYPEHLGSALERVHDHLVRSARSATENVGDLLQQVVDLFIPLVTGFRLRGCLVA